MRPRLCAVLLRLALALGGAAVALALAELCVRAFDPLGVSYHTQIFTMRRILRWSHDVKLFYEQIPGGSMVHRGIEYRINSLGHRGPEHDPTLRDARRLLGIGDSVMEGLGVPERDAFIEVVGRKLNAGGARWDTYNAGVGSYDIHKELEVLRVWGPRLKPDVLVHCLVSNDVAQAPPPISPRFPGWPVYLKNTPPEFARNRRGWYDSDGFRAVLPSLSDLLVHVIGIRHERALQEMLARDGLTPEDAVLKGKAWKDTAAAIAEYCTLARQVAPLVVFVAFLDTDRSLMRAIEEIVTKQGVLFVAVSRDARWKRVDPALLRISIADAHPTTLGHQLMAEMVHDAIGARYSTR